jgi:hypothetical protein
MNTSHSTALLAPTSIARTPAQRRHERDLRWFFASREAILTMAAQPMPVGRARDARSRTMRRAGLVAAALTRLPVEQQHLLSGLCEPVPQIGARVRRALGVTAFPAFVSKAVADIGGIESYLSLLDAAVHPRVTVGTERPSIDAFVGVRRAIEREVHAALVAFGRLRNAQARSHRPLAGFLNAA